MSLPIRANAPGQPPAPASTHLVVGSNGVFLSIDNNWVRAVVPCPDDEVPNEAWDVMDQREDLEEVALSCVFKPRPIPAELMYRIAKFFREVRDKHHTEVAVLLYYGERSGWSVSVPKQEVTAGHVDYRQDAPCVPTHAEQRREGRRLIGTMHSHVDMSAWHSGVDEHDEASQDGLHVTIGKVGDLPGSCDLAPEVVVRGQRFDISPDVFTSAFTVVEERESAAPDSEAPNPVAARLRKLYMTFSTRPSHAIADPEAYAAVEVPAEWHEPVEVTTYSWGGRPFATGAGADDGDDAVDWSRWPYYH